MARPALLLLLAAAQFLALSAAPAAAQAPPAGACASSPGSCAGGEEDEAAFVQRLHVNRLASRTGSTEEASTAPSNDGPAEVPEPRNDEVPARNISLDLDVSIAPEAQYYGGDGPVATCGPGCGSAGSTRCPLVVVLHGQDDNNAAELRYLLFGPGDKWMFAEATFCIVFPEPVGGNNWDLSVGDTPDFQHVTQVSKQAVTQLNVDPAAVYLVGYSRGGVFGYKMMCSLAKLPFVAYASIESQPLYIQTNKGKECCPDLKFHLMAVQGSNDQTFPPNKVRATDANARTEFCADQPQLVAQHGRANACAGPVEQQATIMPATRITAYESGCDAGGSASLYMVEGGTHASILGNALWRQIWQYFTVVAPASGP